MTRRWSGHALCTIAPPLGVTGKAKALMRARSEAVSASSPDSARVRGADANGLCAPCERLGAELTMSGALPPHERLTIHCRALAAQEVVEGGIHLALSEQLAPSRACRQREVQRLRPQTGASRARDADRGLRTDDPRSSPHSCLRDRARGPGPGRRALPKASVRCRQSGRIRAARSSSRSRLFSTSAAGLRPEPKLGAARSVTFLGDLLSVAPRRRCLVVHQDQPRRRHGAKNGGAVPRLTG